MGFWKRTADNKLLLRVYVVDLQPPLHQIRSFLLVRLHPTGSQSSSGERIRRTPYHWWNLSSPAPWPPKPAIDLLSLLEEGALTEGRGTVCSVTVCAQQGAKSGSGAAGFIMAPTWPGFRGQNRPMFRPRFSPDLARINTITCMCPSWLTKGRRACRGGVLVGWRGCYMRIYAWPAGVQVSMRE